MRDRAILEGSRVTFSKLVRMNRALGQDVESWRHKNDFLVAYKRVKTR